MTDGKEISLNVTSMLWRTHVLAGISSLWLLQPVSGVFTTDTLAPALALAALGALLPDLDATESKIKYLEVGGIRPFAPLSIATNQAFGHRGLLHSPVMLVSIGLFAALLSIWWGGIPSIALWLGYASHLLMDSCTSSGIPQRPYKGRLHLLPSPLRIVTGSPAEDVVFALLAVLTTALLLQYLPLANF